MAKATVLAINAADDERDSVELGELQSALRFAP